MTTERLLRDTLMVLECLRDENDRLGSLKVEVPKEGHPRQWLIEYVRDDLKLRVEEAIKREEEKKARPNDYLGALKELERRERHRAIYNRAWEEAVFGGASREEAHDAARKAAFGTGSAGGQADA